MELNFQLNPYYWAKGRQQGKGSKPLENLKMALDIDDIGIIGKLTQNEAQ